MKPVLAILAVLLCTSVAVGQARTAERIVDVPHSQLTGALPDDSIRYVINGLQGTVPCTAGGNGALAIKVAGVWHCPRLTVGVNTGDVGGPASSADGELPLYNGLTGKNLKNSTSLNGIVFLTAGVVSTLTSSGTGAVARVNGPALVNVDASSIFNTGTVPPARVISGSLADAKCLRYASGQIVLAADDCGTGGGAGGGGITTLNTLTATTQTIDAANDTNVTAAWSQTSSSNHRITLGWTGTLANSRLASGIDATKLADGSVTSTEFQYINSLTSNAQTQLNNKATLSGIETFTAAHTFDPATLIIGGVSTLPTPVVPQSFAVDSDDGRLFFGVDDTVDYWGEIFVAGKSSSIIVAYGGTGLTSGTSGGIPYFSSSSTMASSAVLTANLPVIGGGAGAAPSVGTRSGNTTAFVTTTGTQTSGRCVEIDANGNHIAAAAACGSGGGSGTVTNTGGNLTSNAVVLGAGTNDAKVVAGIISDGVSKFTLGVAGTSVGAIDFKNATSGTITLSPVTGALGTVTISVPARTATMATTTGTLTSGRCAEFDASGNLIQSAAACGVTGANAALSNLASVAINTTLVSDTDNTDDLGTSSIGWRTGYFKTSVLSPVYSSTAANPADAGVIRLGNTEIIGWEAATPGTDITIAVNASDEVAISSTVAIGASPDVTFGRAAANVGTVPWVQETSAQGFVTSDLTNATTTMSNVTGMSITVTSGRKYSFRMVLYVSDSTAADGAKFDFDGGTATATNFRCHCTGFDSALAHSSQTTAIATDFVISTLTGASLFECFGSIEPSASGTVIPRYAQNAHTAGTLTLARGSHILWKDMP